MAWTIYRLTGRRDHGRYLLQTSEKTKCVSFSVRAGSHHVLQKVPLGTMPTTEIMSAALVKKHGSVLVNNTVLFMTISSVTFYH